MKLEDLRDAYYDATGTTSSIVRSLGLGGIAAVWLLSESERAVGEALSIPPALKLPGVLIVLSLTGDLLQYMIRSATFGTYNWVLERRGTTSEDEFRMPRKLIAVPLILFWLKCALLLGAYSLVLRYAWLRL